jgi:hypothetical protein
MKGAADGVGTSRARESPAGRGPTVPELNPPRPNMYVLLELDAGVSADRLRYVYEQHVADAARSQDHRRLLHLSRAFDGLPASVRAAMYPKVSTARAGATGWRDERYLSAPVANTAFTASRAGRRRQRPSVLAPAPNPCPNRGRRRMSSGRGIAASLTIALLVGGLQFARAKQLFGSHDAAGALPAAGPQLPVVDAQAVANHLDRSNGRDDITCQAANAYAQALTCQASDGMTWAVSVVAPPDQYTATVTRGSTFEQSARFDAWNGIDGVQTCRKQSGVLPASVSDQVGQAHLACAGGVMTMYLSPGNRLDYRRLDTRRFMVTVTASDGETVTYRSFTNRFSPSY